MLRRSSINEDFIRRHSATPDRVSLALESLALISDPDNPSSNQQHNYGSTQKDSFGYDTDNTQHERSVSERLLGEAAILKDELSSMIILAIPVIATYLLEIVPGMITIFLVGRMDNGDDNVLHLDAAALGVMFFNIVGLSTVSSCEVSCSFNVYNIYHNVLHMHCAVYFCVHISCCTFLTLDPHIHIYIYIYIKGLGLLTALDT